MCIYREGVDSEKFVEKLTNMSFPENQEGFNLLAREINVLINPNACFGVELNYNQATQLLGITIHSIGYDERTFYTCIARHDMYDDICRIEDIITAFACGLGFSY